MEVPDIYVQGKNSLLDGFIQAILQCGILASWQHENTENLETDVEKTNMFSLGKITKMEELPKKPQLKKIILEAMELTDMGVTLKKAAPAKTEVEVPDYFQNALGQNKKALEIFGKASPSFRKEYVNWIVDAKTEATRNKRMEQALEWISEGKGRNWKYEKK